MTTNTQRVPHREGEEGYMLLAVVVMCALVLLALSVAAAVVAKDLRRDKEIASQQYMQEYVRAIQLYYRKNNSYPPSMKALEQTNNIRYLREKFVDPLTGKDDWRIIHQGEQKTTIKSFFGKELAGLPGGGGGLGSAAGLASNPSSGASTGTSIPTGCSAANLTFCSQPVTTSTSGGSSGSTGASGASGATGSSGTGMFGDSTGGIIVGVGTSKTGNSITEPNGQTTYETWEFWYDPRIELLKAKVNILGGGISSSSASGFGQSATGFGGAPGSTGPTGSTTAPVGGGGLQQQQLQQPQQ